METARKLLNRYRVTEFEAIRPERGVKKVQYSLWSIHAERRFPVVQMQGAQQPIDTVKMVSMEMTDEYRVDFTSPHTGTHQLYLCSFATVEQKHVSVADQCRR